MPVIKILFFFFLMVPLASMQFHPTELQKEATDSRLFSAEKTSRNFVRSLSKPLIGNDGMIFVCCEKDFFGFESNGSIAWMVHLNYTCNVGFAPVYGGRETIYVVAENRVVKINLLTTGTSEPAAKVILSFQPDKEGNGEIIGISVSTSVSSVFVNIKGRGLFAFSMHGQLIWSAGPVLNQFGYPQGCRKNATDCYFTSVPVIDRCEASIYISSTEGELYSLSIPSPHFRWIQDLSSFDKEFTVTPGNNGRLYVVVPVKALLLALDASSGNVLWQGSIGPLSSLDSAPVVDSNGWVSLGSLDGFLYSFSPDGVLKKFSKAIASDSAIQVSPVLDCSGYAVYISQTEMEGKISRIIGDNTYTSSLKPTSVVFSLFVPATGSIYWSESYSGESSFTLSSSLLLKTDLHDFLVDERILLAFFAAAKTGNPLACRSRRQKLIASCSQARPKQLRLYTNNERAIFLFLVFETAILIGLAVLVRFCCVFWKKKKLKAQDLGSFLDKRRSLQLKKKSFDRSITELQSKAAEEAVANEVLEELGDLMREREGIERKLSSTYSLGRDGASSQSKSLLPLYDGKTRSLSFQSAKKERVTIFHTLSDTSSTDSGSESENSWTSNEDELGTKAKAKAKAKAKVDFETESSSGEEIVERELWRSPSDPTSSSRGNENTMWRNNNGSRSLSLKRRKALS
ncbi:hypothetical protein UlMin_014433 [Ulmus minor]